VAGQACFDLDLLIDRDGDRYRARVLRSPAGDGQAVTFPRPFSDLELENFLLKMGRSRGRTRRIESTSVTAAKQFGGRLFSAVFTGQVGECLRRSVDRAQDEDAPLRIRLRLADCPELADLPWEFLYDKDDDWFVALSGATPIVRYLQLPNQPRPLSVTLPLRILAVRSEPADYPPLDLDAEWSQAMTALREFTDSGAITVTDLAAPTLSELRRALLRERFHILHYMGHGGFTAEDGGVLLFTDQAGRGVPVTGEQLSVMLRDHTSLRLAVLNACEAGRADPADPFGGFADTLVRRGIPAVIAMQFEISDTAAIEFAPALYGALAAGRPVDAAVAEARKAIYAVSPLEWATPVLHLRADNARLFDVTQPATAAGRQPAQPGSQIPAQMAEADRLTVQGHYARAESVLRSVLRADPSRAEAYAGLARTLNGLRRYQESEAAGREAIRLVPGLALGHSALGRALSSQKRFPEAEAACRTAIRLEPALARVHTNLGAVLWDKGEQEEAESCYREAIRLDPDFALARGDLGGLLRDLKRYPEAEAELREALRLDPDLGWVHANLGAVYLDTERYPEAEAELREAIRLDRAHVWARNWLGDALFYTKRYQEAEQCYREAIPLDPDLAWSHANLGGTLVEMKRYREGAAELREALRLDPAHEYARDTFDRLPKKWR
jgi:tetratricopeptide (TPR) repeat protein